MQADIAIGGTTVGRRLLLAVAAAATLYAFAVHGGASLPSSGGESGITVDRSYGSMPLAFEPNAGRTTGDIDFIARSSASAAFIDDSGARLVIGEGKRAETIGLQLIGAAAAQPERLERLPGVVNDLHGTDPSRWRTDIPTFARIRYREVYEGIAVDWYGRERKLEYDFRIAPGGDPRSIGVRVAGAERTRIAPNGDLVIEKGAATFRQKAPVAYQPRAGGGRDKVRVGFDLQGSDVLRFDVGGYDRARPLVIDPVVLAYSSYLGGDAEDVATGIAVDSSGAAYVTGRTLSSDFDTVGAIEGDGGDSDAFVTKLNPAGDQIVYSTYVGGGGKDWGTGITLGPEDTAYVVGTTESTDFNTTPGSFEPQDTGDLGTADAFVLKLSPSGDSLAYSTYLGADAGTEESAGAYDDGNAIAVDAAGAAYVTGRTAGTDFPMVNAIEGNTSESESSPKGNPGGPSRADAFVSKLNPEGSALEFSTYLGGNKGDVGNAIAVDSSGAVYVAGATNSTDFNTQKQLEGYNGDANPNDGHDQFDAFLAKIDPQQAGANALVYSTYLGGTDYDAAHGIAVDGSGAAYVTGATQSDDFDTQNPIDTSDTGADAFVSKLAFDGNALTLAYSTFLSGSGGDSGNAITVDPAGTAYVAGHTRSPNLDTAGAIEGASGSADAFVASIAPGGASLGCATYLGGSADDRGGGIALDPTGMAYVAGSTDSTDFDRIGGVEGDSASTDAFVSKLDLSGPCERSEPGSGPPPDDLRVYVVVLDGLRPGEINANLTPHLNELKQSGTWYKQARSVLIAETLPNHAAMMTGTLPQRNGVVANDFWEPGGSGSKYRMMLPERLESETLFTTLEESCDISTAAVQSKLYLWRLFAGESPSPSDPVVQRRPDYVFNPVLDPAFIPSPDEHTPDAQVMGNGFLPWMRQQPDTGPQFAFLNLGDIDRSGHADPSGPYTAGGLTAFRQAALTDTDQQIGMLVDELKGSGEWDKTVFIFTSDHGMDWSTPTSTIEAANAANAAAAGSVNKYVLNGGAAMLYINDGFDLLPIANRLLETPGVSWVATRTRVAPDIPTLDDAGIGHRAAGEIVAFAEPGRRFDQSGSNPIPGNHGHSATQHSALFVAGGHPALADAPVEVDGETVYDPDNRLFAPPTGGPGNLSIAPTVAALFGVEPPTGGYDGKPLVEAFDEGALDPHTTCAAGSKLPPAPDLTISDVSVPEGDEGTRDAAFTVALSAPYPREITVDYATADGTATAPDDYGARSGTVTFAPNEISQTISVPVQGDTIDEPDETFQVTLSNPSSGTLLDATGEATIVDDDEAGPVEPAGLSIGDVTISEGDEGTRDAEFVVSLSRASDAPVTADYATADGSATAASDYDAVNGALTLAPGETSTAISVPVRGDTIDEPDENFFVDLTNVSGADAGDTHGEGVIIDDDAPPSGGGGGGGGGDTGSGGGGDGDDSPSGGTPTSPGDTNTGSERPGDSPAPDGPTDQTATARCDGVTATIAGTTGSDLADVLLGTRRKDVIAARAGNDQARGMRRADLICGGRGDDTLYGGRGDDRLFGGPGRDHLVGGKGADIIRCGRGFDTVRAGPADSVGASCEKVIRS